MANNHSCKRHPNFKDLTGKRFGRLLVIRLVGFNNRRRALWLCRCDCGVEKIISSGHLLRGETVSCGCWKRDEPKTRATHGDNRVGKRAPEYRAWADMIQRCYNPNRPRYKTYGARGVKVCARWRESYEAFLADVGRRPSDKHSLDRKDNDNHYSCGNCEECRANSWTLNAQWATRREQANKTTRNRFITYQGRTQTLAQWAKELGIKPLTLAHRIFKAKWPLDQAMTVAVRKSNVLTPMEILRHRASRAAVNKAVKCGRLPRVSTLKCVYCGEQAHHYHHGRGHSFKSRLDVEPVCKTCHGKL